MAALGCAISQPLTALIVWHSPPSSPSPPSLSTRIHTSLVYRRERGGDLELKLDSSGSLEKNTTTDSRLRTVTRRRYLDPVAAVKVYNGAVRNLQCTLTKDFSL